MKFFLIFFLCPFILRSQISSITLPAKSIIEPTKIDTVVENWNSSLEEYSNISYQQKELLYWTNYARINPKRFWDSVIFPVMQIFPQLNGSYSVSLKKDLLGSQTFKLYKLNLNLIKMAQDHSADISKKSAGISHSSTTGQTFEQRFNFYSIKNCAAENISLSDNILFGLILLYLDLNEPDLGHRKNLLSKDYTEIGVGTSLYGNTQDIFFVQDFACPQ